ncbi:TetR/AcrR family transcriptional regulator [Pseudomonas syringae]|uniref:TetR/AcrR family transcriptional regulator n=1 Tax=Pseudomonas syringae TaxID=317 RepID=UPI001CA992CE|nr:TetR/AcrR family transcriptional regulator [Pseudomonas syringae]MCI3945733.1 TetR/AcrR family transcriptional regulator [Pseudomonas syringae]
MTTNVNRRARGRPREFVLEDAIQVGQHLFHEHGYENVSVASLTEAIGITAPSFYTAFGSKGAFFNDALKHYSATVVPLDCFLIPGKSPQTALLDMLRAAAHAYAAHPQRRGCFILEHAKAGTTEWGSAAKQIADENRARVMTFLEASGIPVPDEVVDYVAVTMLGLSAAAREGWEERRLIAVVDIAAVNLEQLMLGAQVTPDAPL